jgi:type II secretory pathway pseudopilin PulG
VAEAIAIVSIVSGAAVAVLVPFINARLERSRLAQQSQGARLEELRGILDAALQQLYVAATIFYEIREWQKIREWQNQAPKPEWEGRISKHVSQLSEQVDKVNEQGLRIQLRTPQGAAIATAFAEAANHVLRYEVAFRHFFESESRQPEQPPPPFNEMTVALAKFLEEVRKFAGVVPAPSQPPRLRPNGLSNALES